VLAFSSQPDVRLAETHHSAFGGWNRQFLLDEFTPIKLSRSAKV
jgi:hypothetical protein